MTKDLDEEAINGLDQDEHFNFIENRRNGEKYFDFRIRRKTGERNAQLQELMENKKEPLHFKIRLFKDEMILHFFRDDIEENFYSVFFATFTPKAADELIETLKVAQVALKKRKSESKLKLVGK